MAPRDPDRRGRLPPTGPRRVARPVAEPGQARAGRGGRILPIGGLGEEPGVRPRLESQPSGPGAGRLGGQHDPRRDGQDADGRVDRSMVSSSRAPRRDPEPGVWRSVGDERRGAGPRGEPPRRPPPARGRPGRAGPVARSRSWRARSWSSTTGSSTAGWPATSTSSCSTPSTRSAWEDLPQGSAPRAGRVAPEGRRGRPLPGRPGRRGRRGGRSGRRPSVEPGRSAGSAARHAPLDLIDAGGGIFPALGGARVARSRPSAGSATRRGSGGPWKGSAWTSSASGPSLTIILIRRDGRGRPGRLAPGSGGRAGLDHPEGFGQASGPEPRPGAASRLADRAGRHGRVRGRSNRPSRRCCPRERIPLEPTRSRPDATSADPRPRRPPLRAAGRSAEQGRAGRPGTGLRGRDLARRLARRPARPAGGPRLEAAPGRDRPGPRCGLAGGRGPGRARRQDGVRPLPDRLDRPRGPRTGWP